MTFHRFDEIDSFVDANSSKVTLAKSYNDILAAKQAGKVAMVIGVQDLWPLELAVEHTDSDSTILLTIGMPTRRRRTFPGITKGGSGSPISLINLSSFFGGGCLDPTTPLSRAGRYIVGQMQEIGILVDCTPFGRTDQPRYFQHGNPAGCLFTFEPCRARR